MKKITAVVLSFLILASGFTALANGSIHEYKKTYDVANGISHTSIKRFYGTHWNTIQVMEVDLAEENVSIDLMMSDVTVNKLETTSKMAEKRDAVGAINADFFQWYYKDKSYGNAKGIEIMNGNMFSSPAHEKEFSAMWLNENNVMNMGFLQYSFTVTAPNGEVRPIKHVNKYDDLAQIEMYTSDWNHGMSPGGCMELVVENNIVVDIRYTTDPVAIPENGYVLSVLWDYSKFFHECFKVGDPVVISMEITPDMDNIKMAVGGGAIVLQDGMVPKKFNQNISGYHPRTALGFDKSGTKLFLVTVDGRKNNNKGMTQTELGYFMAEIGAHSAVNLDGGGSTTFVSKDFWDNKRTVKNTPSDGAERKVKNALGVFSLDGGEVAGLKINPVSHKVISGLAVSIPVLGSDKYGNPKEIDKEKLDYEIEGVDGGFAGSYFYPKNTGTAMIKAVYGEFEATTRVDVLPCAKLELSKRYISMKPGESVDFSAFAYGTDGFFEVAGNSRLKTDSEEVKIVDGKITTNAVGNFIVGVTLGEAKTWIQVVTDGTAFSDLPEDITLPDPKWGEKGQTEGSIVFSVMATNNANSTFIDGIAQSRLIKNGSDIFGWVGVNSKEFNSQKAHITNKDQYCFDVGDVSFIGINDITQSWTYLSNILKTSDKRNVAIMLGGAEVPQLLHDILKTSPKNIMVFMNAGETSVANKDGVRYFKLASTENASKAGVFGTVERMKYAKIYVSDSGFSYTINNLF